MSSDKKGKRTSLDDASFREMRLLEEVQRTPEVSQRQLAGQLGVALGVANALIRSLARRGYIKATRIGWKRWVYVVTPAGISRKVHLTFGYIENFLGHYSRVRELLRQDLGSLGMDADSPIAVYGTTELAELVYLALQDLGFSQVEFCDRSADSAIFMGLSVRSLDSISPQDYVKVIVSSSSNVEDRRQELLDTGIAPCRIVTLLQGTKHWSARAKDKGDRESNG